MSHTWMFHPYICVAAPMIESVYLAGLTQGLRTEPENVPKITVTVTPIPKICRIRSALVSGGVIRATYCCRKHNPIIPPTSSQQIDANEQTKTNADERQRQENKFHDQQCMASSLRIRIVWCRPGRNDLKGRKPHLFTISTPPSPRGGDRGDVDNKRASD